MSGHFSFRGARFALAVAVLAVGLSRTAGAQSPFLKQDDYAGVVILVGEKASDIEKAAAAELVDYWRRVTGQGALSAKKPLKNLGMNVWIGKSDTPEELLHLVSFDGLGADGFCIKTVRPKKKSAGHMLIAGGSDLGTAYGVYHFIEEYLGVRFLTPDAAYVPKTPPPFIPEINLHFTPPIMRRQVYYETQAIPGVPDDLRAAYARRMHWCSQPEFGLAAHSIFTLLPPDKYFAEHPDFYSEVNGKRVAPLGIDLTVPENMAQHADLCSQLCFSNPKVAEAIAEELKPLIKAAPEKQIWSVSQMDWDASCTCAECSKTNEREGTPMGALLTCVNRVAALVHDEFPDSYIETTAERWSRKPPRTITARDNVIITLSATDRDYAKTVTDPSSPLNKTFAEDLMGWSRVAKNIFLQDAPANAYFAQIPFPDFHVLGADYAFYAQHNVKGISIRGNGSFSDDLGALRCCILSHLLWKPDTDVPKLMDNFMEGYYEDAGAFINLYVGHLTRALQEKGVVLERNDKGRWLDSDTIEEAEELITQALTVAKTDAVKQRVEDVHSSLRYCALVCPPQLKTKDEKFTVTRPACGTVDEYIKSLEARGFKPPDPNRPLAEYVTQRTGAVAAPRKEESPIETLENENYLVWVTPAIKGAILRLRDKRSGAEFLRGYDHYGTAPGTWQDWRTAPAEGPAAEAYEVADKKPGILTLRAKRDDGLVIERTMTLKPGSETFDVTLVMTNATDKPLAPAMKLHPEFFTQGETPEIYVSKKDEWTRQNSPGAKSESKAVPLESQTRIAFCAPTRRLCVVCTFDPKEVGGLSWSYNADPDQQRCNLELTAKPDALKPGEKATLHATYTLLRDKPAGM